MQAASKHAERGLAFVGKRVEKDDVLAFLEHHIEAYNKGNLQGEIAELEARIALQETKLAHYLKAPLAVPPIKIDEAKGEIHALRQKRKELLPTLVEREEIRAPIGGVVSASNVVAGQVVDAREVLFEIVDPARYWVEAIAHDAGVVTNFSAAFAVTNSGETLPLEFAGLGLSLKQQAAPLTFQGSANVRKAEHRQACHRHLAVERRVERHCAPGCQCGARSKWARHGVGEDANRSASSRIPCATRRSTVNEWS